jgi:hypothetical protein
MGQEPEMKLEEKQGKYQVLLVFFAVLPEQRF